MRDQTPAEGSASAFATLLVFASSALAVNASTVGGLIIALLLFLSAGVLGLCNALTEDLRMFGRTLHVSESNEPDKKVQEFPRKRAMVDYLIAQSNRDDWALGMQLIPDPERPSLSKQGRVTIDEYIRKENEREQENEKEGSKSPAEVSLQTIRVDSPPTVAPANQPGKTSR